MVPVVIINRPTIMCFFFFFEGSIEQLHSTSDQKKKHSKFFLHKRVREALIDFWPLIRFCPLFLFAPTIDLIKLWLSKNPFPLKIIKFLFLIQDFAVNAKATEADNVFVVSIEIKTNNSARLDITIKSEESNPIPCLTRISCQICSDLADCYSDLEDSSLFDLIPKTEFGTRLQYHCPLGQEFDVPDSNRQTYELECLWNGDWSGSLPQCRGKYEDKKISYLQY